MSGYVTKNLRPIWADCVEKLEKPALSFFCQFSLRWKSWPYLRVDGC
jgi:hypothetical protein